MRTMRKAVASVLVASMMVSGVPQGVSVKASSPKAVVNGMEQNTQRVVSEGAIIVEDTKEDLIQATNPEKQEATKIQQDIKKSVLSEDKYITITNVEDIERYTEQKDSVKAIIIQTKNIDDGTVKKLYDFQNVEILDLSQNSITTIDLSKWKNLKAVWLNNNQLTTLDVSENTKLELLQAYGNYNLTGDLKLENHSALKELYVNDTKLTNITLPTTSSLVATSFNNNPSLKKIVYPKSASGSAIDLKIDGTSLYQQDYEGDVEGGSTAGNKVGEKGTYIEWTINNGSSKVLGKEESVPAYGYTATAQWKLKKYKIVYILPKGIQWKSEKETSSIKEGEYGKEVTLPSQDDFTLDVGYEWKGWNTSFGKVTGDKLVAKPSKDGVTITVSPNIEKKMTAEEQAQKYTITFDKGVENPDDVQGIMETYEGKVGEYFYFPDCNYTRPGYTFAGWRIDSNPDVIYGKQPISKHPVVRIGKGGKRTVTALWKANTGTIKIGEKSISVTADKQGVYTLTQDDLASQTKQGYEFTGWTYQGKVLQEGNKIVLGKDGDNIEVTGNYVPNKYYVEYVDENNQKIGEELLTVGIPSDVKILNDKDDKVFVGWKKVNNTRFRTLSASEKIYYTNEKLVNLSLDNGDVIRLQAVYGDKSQQMVMDAILDQTYTGTEIRPDITIKVGDIVVDPSKYTVIFNNNIDVGLANVTVTPKEEQYIGVNATFNITKATIEPQQNSQKQVLQEKGNTITLSVPKDSKVYYRTQDSEEWSMVVPRFYEAGTYKVEYEITNPNYETLRGVVELTITSNPSDTGGSSTGGGSVSGGGSGAGTQTTPTEPTKPETDKETSEKPSTQKPSKPSKPTKPSVDKGFSIPKIENQVYTGKNKVPNPVIKVGDKVLKKGKDYKVTYKNANKIGKVTVTVTGIGAYKGLKTTYTYTILPKKPKMAVKTGKSAIQITTKAQKGTKQLIQYSSNNGKTWKTIRTSAGTKTIKGLKKGTYKVRVSSYKLVKGVTYKSAYTTKMTVKVK